MVEHQTINALSLGWPRKNSLYRDQWPDTLSEGGIGHVAQELS